MHRVFASSSWTSQELELLLTHLESQMPARTPHSKTGPAATSRPAPKVSTSRPFWWRCLPDDDPISLEPLRRLRVPPFELKTSLTHSCYFDGSVLASYLVSTGSFVHPTSRRELTREDCASLDAHLRQHRLERPCVASCFDAKEDYTRQQSPENRVRLLQEEAATLLQNLYSRPGSSSRSRHSREAPPDETTRQEEVLEPAPEVFDVNLAAEFPGLSHPITTSPMRGAWWGGGANAHEKTEDFPELPGALSGRKPVVGGCRVGETRQGTSGPRTQNSRPGRRSFRPLGASLIGLQCQSSSIK